MQLGSSLIERKGRQGASDISHQMRLLARLVIAARKVTNQPTALLKALIMPSCLDNLVDATKVLSGFGQAENDYCPIAYKAPSVAIRLRHVLKKAALILQGQALRNEDDTAMERTERFIRIHESEWHDKVSSTALKALSYRVSQNISL